MTKRVLIRIKVGFHDPCPILQLFEQAQMQVEHLPGQAPWSQEETRQELEGMDGLLAGGDYANEYTLELADQLKIVARSGVGFDRVDLDLCTRRGIVVTNTPGAMADAVADETLALMLALIRRLPQGDRSVKSGGYVVPLAEELASMTLGLVGCGRIGVEVAQRAASFKMRLLVRDPYLDAGRIRDIGATVVELDDLLAQSDVVSLHMPLTDESSRIVNRDFLARMKPGSFLINSARGGLVDEGALIEALESGHLAGAGLDCQATEPPEGRSADLVRLESVIAMPHAASNTLSSRERMAMWAAQSIIDCLEDRTPEHVVNRDVLNRLPHLSKPPW